MIGSPLSPADFARDFGEAGLARRTAPFIALASTVDGPVATGRLTASAVAAQCTRWAETWDKVARDLESEAKSRSRLIGAAAAGFLEAARGEAERWREAARAVRAIDQTGPPCAGQSAA